ncbi:hypothetical protein FGLOB1_14571 [Fusarium globosum]|uniref:Uncharacterized protein n=1 Tax=Fusarium globosum TaxID=78864 RepID=A0A8H5XDN7_9HYPO|nr:hypothetical protein FGLOB1_14571 [Fusarium globosum]
MDKVPPFVPGLNYRLVSTQDNVLDGLKARGNASKDKIKAAESNMKKFKETSERPNDDKWNQYTGEYRKVTGTGFPYERNDVYVQFRT